MFCDKCGAQLPEGTRFCGQCGNSFEPVQQPAYQQQVYQQPAQPMTRNKFFSTSCGSLGWAARIVLILCAVLIGVSLCMALWGSILKMPVVSMMATLAGEDVDELEDMIRDEGRVLDEAKEELEYVRDREDLTRKEEKALEMVDELVEDAEDIMDAPSIAGTRSLLTKVMKVNDEMYDLDMGYTDIDNIQDLEEIGTVLDVAITVIVIFFGIGLLLTALAAVFRNNVLTVFGMLSSVCICCLLANMVLGLLLLALFIAAIVLNAKLSGQYKAYKQSLGIYS